METREYGTKGPLVAVLHGGPGAPGELAPVARELAADHRVLEPLQRRSGGEEPLSVSLHVADLAELLSERSRADNGRPITLIGSSWGAMLALATAAAHPELVGPIALVGCGTFDLDARAVFQATLDKRVDQQLHARLEYVAAEVEDPDEQLGLMGAALVPAYVFDPDPTLDPHADVTAFDARGFRESWSDMVRLQTNGTYPAAFKAITSPVLMLHGAWDPHPGEMIHESLRSHLRALEYQELESCGHYPWLERMGRDRFYEILRGWLPDVR